MKKITLAGAILSVAGVLNAGTLTLTCPTADIAEYRTLAEFAKSIGATHLGADQIEHSLWQWNRNRYDPYPNWSMHRPSIFKFVVPEKLKKYLPEDYANRNLEMLRKRAAVLKEFGLKADFVGMEPAYFPEEAYLEHPTWRGSRCDQARRARFEYYAPCMENSEVKEMYIEAIAKLCQVCPFDHFNFRCNDSGAAICWSENLYSGKNGPEQCKDVPYGKRVADALSVFQEGAAKGGLPNAKVNLRANVGPLEAVLPCLRPGQSVNNCAASGRSASWHIGFPNGIGDSSIGLFGLSRLPYYVEQLQKAEMHPGEDIEIGLRSMLEYDAHELLTRYLAKGRKIGQGQVAKWKAVEEIAAAFVGAEHAVALASAWQQLEQSLMTLDNFQSGGNLILLGTIHQRWLTRPFVPFPGELKGEDRSYWRDYTFQAQEESDADNLLDLQGNRWLSGHGGCTLFTMAFNRTMLPCAKRAAAGFKKAIEQAVDARAKRYLTDQLAKIRMYTCILVNAQHAVEFQSILDRTDFTQKPTDTSPVLNEQGDLRLHKLNLIVRAEIDNTLSVIDILENSDDPVFAYAKSDEFQTVMKLPPKATLIRDLKHKIAVMEQHRRDFLRLYKSYNR